MPALPRFWLFTDERQGDDLWRAIAALPRGGGIVFRHRSLDPLARRALFDGVRAIARRRGLTLVLAGSTQEARAWRADGAHGPATRRDTTRLLTRGVHDLRELARARRDGVDLAFLSPVWPTRSHPGAPTLGVARFGLLARRAAMPVVALGGVDRRRARALPERAYGWAGIDAWIADPGGGDQKRKAVPT